MTTRTIAPSCAAVKLDLYIPAVRRVARGIFQEIGHHLGDVVRPGDDHDVLVEARRNLDGTTPEGRRGELDRSRDDRAEIEWPWHGSLILCPGKDVEGGSEALQAVYLFPQGLHQLWRRFHHTVTKRLEIALQVGERRPQLVRGIHHELAPYPFLLGERGRHFIKCVR